jgi:hypothetical protein
VGKLRSDQDSLFRIFHRLMNTTISDKLTKTVINDSPTSSAAIQFSILCSSGRILFSNGSTEKNHVVHKISQKIKHLNTMIRFRRIEFYVQTNIRLVQRRKNDFESPKILELASLVPAKYRSKYHPCFPNQLKYGSFPE